MGAYDLLNIKINDKDTTARPIAWDSYDNRGIGKKDNDEDINPIRFMTTCVECAQLIEFNIDEAKRGDMNIGCLRCGIVVPEREIAEEDVGKNVDELIKEVQSSSIVVDQAGKLVDDFDRHVKLTPTIDFGFVLDETLVGIANSIIENDTI
jgi:hypothetical protein